jgi:superfamily II DNA or RNA helicase
MLTLFDPPSPTPTIQRGFILRDFQAIDADEVERQWNSRELRVLLVHATGLGKSLMAAELAARKPPGTRALIIVDSTDLAKELYRTVYKHLGRKPGILTGDYKEDYGGADIVIATKQCLCAEITRCHELANEAGAVQRYKTFNLATIDRIIVDECEAALADEYVSMMVYFIERKPDLKILGMTATPLPAVNRSIADLFSYAASQPGPLYRDLQWAYLNGWLTKPMQGILRCSMDFSSLKVRRQENGERDYSDTDIAKLMLEQDEREWLELGGGIYQIAKGRTAIVVCPNSTEVADKVAGYIEGAARAGGQRDVAFAVHRKLGRQRSSDMMARFKRGEFPIAVSVRMFEKGFDYDRVNMVVMVRRTKSLRLYTQVAGRGTRPLVGIRKQLMEQQDPKERIRIIAEPAKPHCVIVDCVGINDKAKDILGVIDILGRGIREDIKERVRQRMLDRANQPPKEPAPGPQETDEVGIDVGDEARAVVKEIREERERERRARLSGKVDTHFEIEDRRRSRPQDHKLAKPKERGARMLFGRYRGELVRDLSTGYLSTLREKCDIKVRWLADAIDRELKRRANAPETANA